jgi:DNA helicase-2/ATP-dependent DNA helicase PcrA
VSNLKNDLVDEETYASRVCPRTAAPATTSGKVSEAYTMYQRRLRQANAMDFDDLIMSTVHLLQAFPDAAEHYRRRFRHILVDEYQDTNVAQYQLVKELVGPALRTTRRRTRCRRASCASSATPTSRSTRSAVRRSATSSSSSRTTPTPGPSSWSRTTAPRRPSCGAANAVIARNEKRRAKNLWTDSGDGVKIVGYVGDSEHDEAAFVAKQIDHLQDTEGVRPKDVAIFYRTNAQSRAFEEVLVRVGMPYKVVGGTAFYERKEIKDALAYSG